jgi:chitinase
MNLRIATGLVFSVPLLIGFSAGDFALSGTKVEEPDKVFVGYVYQQPQKINFQLYTHLCHAFVVADEDGKIRPNKTCPSRQLVTNAHKAGVKVLISLGGGAGISSSRPS